jgi:hypothetical protein
VIQVRVEQFPSARHLSAKFRKYAGQRSFSRMTGTDQHRL